MKYIVTAPPGGLGHFLARLLANEYDYTVSTAGSYHGLKKNYSSQTTTIEDYDSTICDTDDAVICTHNFDNRDLSKTFLDRTIVNIVVDGHWAIYLNNYYRKAVQDNPTFEQEFLQSCKIKFPTSNNSLREEFFFLYQAACRGKVSWLEPAVTGTNLPFSSFYDVKEFTKSMTAIPGFNLDTPGLVWQHFIKAQQSIIDRVSQYQTICNAVIDNKPVVLPDYFDNVDIGIMCGMIYVQHGKDLLNLDNDRWL